MSPQAEETRQLLIDAATREFAERGIDAASLLEITRQAGQRNRGAVHYHFGSREGMLVAVLEQHVAMLAAREEQLLAAARAEPADDVASVLQAFVRPAVELGELGWKGRCYLMILAEIAGDDREHVHPDVLATLTRTGGRDAFQLLRERCPEMPEELREERINLAARFILRTVADRARAIERESGRVQLETESFVANLVLMIEAMLRAPLPESVTLHGSR